MSSVQQDNLGILRIAGYVVILMAYVAAMLLDIQEIDAAQYATMSRDLLAEGHFLQLYDRGQPYLDKPPLTFWMTELSYAVFGVSGVAYKLPSILFSLLAIWSVRRLGALLYGDKTGAWAGLVLASCQAFFLMNNDVKTDMYLIGGMSLAVWQLVAYSRGGSLWNVQWGFVGIGLAMLAKGPLGLVAPAMAVGGDLLLRRDWKGLFRWQWLTGLPILALMLLPFSWGQYEQYGWDGVKFFFWTQSFGRVTGESEWTNDATPFFFVHTMAWSFLPWFPLFLVAFGRRLWWIVRAGFRVPTVSEGVAVSGFVLIFAALSLSRFKLPHYIFATYPFAALLTAAYIVRLLDFGGAEKARKWVLGGHWVLYVLGALLMGVLTVWCFPEASWLIKGPLLGGTIVVGVLAWRYPLAEERLMMSTVMGFSLLHLLLHTSFYPHLLEYQSTAMAGRYVSEHQIPQDRLFAFESGGRSMDFYSGRVMQGLPNIDAAVTEAGKGPYVVFTNDKGLKALTDAHLLTDTVAVFPHFRVNRLTLPFLNPKTREQTLSKRYLMEVRTGL